MCVSVSAQIQPFLRLGAGYHNLSHPDLPESENVDVHCPEAEGLHEGFSGGVYAGVTIMNRLSIQSGVRAAQRLIELTPGLAEQGFPASQIINVSPDESVQFLRGSWMEVPIMARYDLFPDEDGSIYAMAGATWHRDLRNPQSVTRETKLASPQLPSMWSANLGLGMELHVTRHIGLYGEMLFDMLEGRRGATTRLNAGITLYPAGLY